MRKEPLRYQASVVVITYNQAEYVAQALESIVCQKTNFAFEVIVADDGSSDETPKIIDDYAKKYPDLIKATLRRKNMGAWNNFKDAIRQADGEFMALCEGDDYWIDENKLQKQVDFLRKRPTYSLCFHPVKVFYQNAEREDKIFPASLTKEQLTTGGLLRGNYIQTNSVVYRRSTYEDLPEDILPGDWYLHLYHAKLGKIGYLENQVMAAYRKHDRGLWWDSENSNIWEKHGIQYLSMFVALQTLFKGEVKYERLLEGSVTEMINRLVSIDERLHTSLISKAATRHPDTVAQFALKQSESILNLNVQLRQKEFERLKTATNLSRSMEHVLNIQNSKSFVVGYQLLHPWKVPRFIVSRAKSIVTKAMLSHVKTTQDVAFNKAYEQSGKVLESFARTNNARVAVVIHLYYADLWPYFHDKLQRMNDIPFDLFVSIPINEKKSEELVRNDYPGACVVATPNRGRDVLPFLMIAKYLELKGYSQVLKLHSKKSTHREDGQEWLDGMVDSLIPADDKCRTALLNVLESNDTAIIGPVGQYVSLMVNYEANKRHLRKIISRIASKDVSEKLDANRYAYGFFGGTMFWLNIKTVQPILAMSLLPKDFEIEAGQIDGTLAHAIERVLSIAPELSGQKMYESNGYDVVELHHETTNIPAWADISEA